MLQEITSDSGPTLLILQVEKLKFLCQEPSFHDD